MCDVSVPGPVAYKLLPPDCIKMHQVTYRIPKVPDKGPLNGCVCFWPLLIAISNARSVASGYTIMCSLCPNKNLLTLVLVK